MALVTKYRVTSGRILYSKTIQERQFEPKHAEVELTFELPDGADLNQALEEVSVTCKEEARVLVGATRR
jgi:hypothetical protein